ncbi:hypothetical protein SBOR_0574 [Sclerotinia borealis F-4128]|uniref:Nitrogen permease regulator 2 like protein n=1 Tax=Sclerotinia borealis (strain F-4128) TaxID=1432307 RepID=W9CWT2_SCLBF|nr:hypothetical protein SBOR_0574 [Sclerotinia borealis F-4128]
MKGYPIDQLVYEIMFPKPKTGDPQSFQAFLQRSLVPEVRHETQAFYGHLASQEAKYPGLDYSYSPHRVRLSRFPWHRRLFRAFENLKLTKHEIATLTKWEGTRWAKERFEKEQGITIRDTTGDDIEDWVSPELRCATVLHAMSANEEKELEEAGQSEQNELEEDDGESDAEITSVGTELNERLRAAAAQRHAGNLTAPMDAEWEQWLKDEVEGGSIDISNMELSPDANIMGTRPLPRVSHVYLNDRILSTSTLDTMTNRRNANINRTIDSNTSLRVQRESVTRRLPSERDLARGRAETFVMDHSYRNPPARNAEERSGNTGDRPIGHPFTMVNYYRNLTALSSAEEEAHHSSL